MLLQNKIALVTGASSGIGKSVAISLAKEGCSVVIHYKSNINLAKQVLDECNLYSESNIICNADLTNQNDIEDMFNQISKHFSEIHILVNNAGIFDETDDVVNILAFENTYKNNFLSAIMVTKNTLPLLKEGKIINISSIYGRLGFGIPKASAYSSFKSALENWTKNLAKDLAPEILVNAVSPGRVDTSMWGDLSELDKKELGSAHLIKRMISPQEIADGVIFLVKNDAICGEILTIDGGFSLVDK